MDKYNASLEAMKPLIQKQIPGPRSDAYGALNLEQSRALTTNEKKLVDQKHQLDKPKEKETKPMYMCHRLQQILVDSKKCKQSEIDDLVSEFVK